MLTCTLANNHTWYSWGIKLSMISICRRSSLLSWRMFSSRPSISLWCSCCRSAIYNRKAYFGLLLACMMYIFLPKNCCYNHEDCSALVPGPLIRICTQPASLSPTWLYSALIIIIIIIYNCAIWCQPKEDGFPFPVWILSSFLPYVFLVFYLSEFL